MSDKLKLMKYSIDYLSKFSSSKKNLERVIKNKIIRMKLDSKDKYFLYNFIPEIINKLENNKLIDDKNYAYSKISFLAKQGKSLFFIKNYLIQKGIEKIIFLNAIEEYEARNPSWEINSAMNFVRKKKLIKSNDNFQKNLSKMSRAGFSYEISTKILNKI